jgi:hypothetical protein
MARAVHKEGCPPALPSKRNREANKSPFASEAKEVQMITTGSLFIERDVPRPLCFQIQDDAHRTGWLPVKYDRPVLELDAELSRRGWTFFYMANVVRKTAFAFDRDKGTSAALKLVMTSVREEGCNCLQIDKVEAHSFFGIPYVSVSAHPRHIQKGMDFSPHSRLPGTEPKLVEVHPQKIGA